MNPENYPPKPHLTPERSHQLANDSIRMKRELEERREWLILEKKKVPSSEQKILLDKEINKIAQVLEALRASEPSFTEDDAVRFLHDAAQLLGHTKYAHSADIHPFKPKEK